MSTMKHFSAAVPLDVASSFAKAAQSMDLRTSAAVRAVLRGLEVDGYLSNRVVFAMPRIVDHLTATWGRLALSIDEAQYDRIVHAADQTGVRRQRILGVILTANRHRLKALIREGLQ